MACLTAPATLADPDRVPRLFVEDDTMFQLLLLAALAVSPASAGTPPDPDTRPEAPRALGVRWHDAHWDPDVPWDTATAPGPALHQRGWWYDHHDDAYGYDHHDGYGYDHHDGHGYDHHDGYDHDDDGYEYDHDGYDYD